MTRYREATTNQPIVSRGRPQVIKSREFTRWLSGWTRGSKHQWYPAGQYIACHRCHVKISQFINYNLSGGVSYDARGMAPHDVRHEILKLLPDCNVRIVSQVMSS